jgi:MFS family permease
MGHKYPRQTLVGLALLCTQAFFYNVFFFSFGPMLETFFGSRANGLELKLEYYIYVTIANFAGPILLGRFFDTAGRKTMIVLTYIASALAILGAAILLQVGFLASPLSMTLAWFVIFFFASTAASAAYLTAGESFPSEIRALAFAILFGLSMASGVLGWFIYGILIKDLQPESAVSLFCLLAAGVMAVAALVEGFFGIEYAGESLDRYSPPLSRVVKDGAVS